MKKEVLILLLAFCSICLVCRGQNTKSIEETKKKIENQYVTFCSQLNKQLPMRVDEVTTLKSVAFVNWTMMCYYSVEINMADYQDIELKEFMKGIRDKQKKQIPTMISNGSYQFTQSELYEYLKGTGLKFRFIYHDLNVGQIGVNQFDYKDFARSDKRYK